MKNLILIAIIAGAGFWLLTKIRAGQSLSFIPRDVHFDGLNLVLNLGIVNNSPFPISFNSFQGSVYANDVPLGGVVDLIPARIAPGETVIPLTLTPNLNNITQLIKNIFTSNEAQNLRLQGVVSAENISVPVNAVFQTIPGSV